MVPTTWLPSTRPTLTGCQSKLQHMDLWESRYKLQQWLTGLWQSISSTQPTRVSLSLNLGTSLPVDSSNLLNTDENNRFSLQQFVGSVLTLFGFGLIFAFVVCFVLFLASVSQPLLFQIGLELIKKSSLASNSQSSSRLSLPSPGVAGMSHPWLWSNPSNRINLLGPFPKKTQVHLYLKNKILTRYTVSETCINSFFHVYLKT